MSHRGEDLAARFRQAIAVADEEEKRREAARRERLEEGRVAREALFSDLVAFAEALEIIRVQKHDGGVTLRVGDHFVHFEPMGEGERVRLAFEGSGDEEHRIYREEELGGRWVWAARRRGIEDRIPFFDQGLEELMVRALKLPRPGAEVSSLDSQATLEDVVPPSDDGGAKRKL